MVILSSLKTRSLEGDAPDRMVEELCRYRGEGLAKVCTQTY